MYLKAVNYVRMGPNKTIWPPVGSDDDLDVCGKKVTSSRDSGYHLLLVLLTVLDT